MTHKQSQHKDKLHKYNVKTSTNESAREKNHFLTLNLCLHLDLLHVRLKIVHPENNMSPVERIFF